MSNVNNIDKGLELEVNNGYESKAKVLFNKMKKQFKKLIPKPSSLKSADLIIKKVNSEKSISASFEVFSNEPAPKVQYKNTKTVKLTYTPQISTPKPTKKVKLKKKRAYKNGYSFPKLTRK
jgi:hypothetical protein